jgi:glycosyltransferase involved in cell wall biosynthesis
MNRVRVSVLMAAYNAERTIDEAIESALHQTFRDLEVVVVEDGSSDGTAARVRAHTDPRLRLVRHSQNLGIPTTRRTGVAEARGEYLAILDSDDRAHPTRLEKQVAYLDEHPECALVGSWVRVISDTGETLKIKKKPSSFLELQARSLFRNLVKDATAMARTETVREFGLRDEFPVCELRDLWQRLAAKYEVANLPEVLTDYRNHRGSVTKRHADLVREMLERIARSQLQQLGADFDEEDLHRHFFLCKPVLHRPDLEFVAWAGPWFTRLRDANRTSRLYPEPEFTRTLGEYWWKLHRKAGLSRWQRRAKAARARLVVPVWLHNPERKRHKHRARASADGNGGTP